MVFRGFVPWVGEGVEVNGTTLIGWFSLLKNAFQGPFPALRVQEYLLPMVIRTDMLLCNGSGTQPLRSGRSFMKQNLFLMAALLAGCSPVAPPLQGNPPPGFNLTRRPVWRCGTLLERRLGPHSLERQGWAARPGQRRRYARAESNRVRRPRCLAASRPW